MIIEVFLKKEEIIEVFLKKEETLEFTHPGTQGPKGDQGDIGPAGESWQEQFETVSKNLKSWNSSFGYTLGLLTSITYTDGVSTITKTFNRTGDVLTSIVLSGDTPSGITLTKTLGYTSGTLTSITYS